ncbi:UNVERIFIED_CONTAM: putative late blight resistance proteinR1B-16 [Sesamum calycinum]|uniref:Late blight resistance proteinR1B-16 n=1 Tax=Sesamum calycinum TaxID=2727403 RepID=A0AAW2KMF0_9LAMI
MEDLSRQLAVVADEADDIIDFHVVSQLRERSQDKTRHMAALSSFRQDIDKIIKKIDSITEKLLMVKEERPDVQEQQPVVFVVLLHFLPVTRILWWDLMSACFSVQEILLKYFFKDEESKQELEEIGRNIARCCRGLPLAIVVIGGLLAKSNKTREYWEYVVENITSFVHFGDDDYCLKILSLSYNSLPIHLKPCFLYMRVFPEDDEIEASKLIDLWIGEGFLKPVGDKSLKEVAKEYLKDLADRNLILIRTLTRTGKIRTCGVHDILRELCVRESEREHLIRVPGTQEFHYSVQMNHDVCFLCSHKLDKQNKIHLEEVVVGFQSTTVASPSVCETCNNKYQNLNKLRWVKVLIEAFPDFGSSSLDSTSLLEVWELPKLRDFRVCNGRLPNPMEARDSTILADLSTLELNKLESLSIRYYHFGLENIAFPTSLKKLRLSYCRFSWEKMTIIGSSLPNLEVLKLENTCDGAEWSPIEGEFLGLKVLFIENYDLEQWAAEDIHFPNLHGLYLQNMWNLKEIPLSIGDINTLHSIHLIGHYSESLMNSALEIVEDQKEKGNESLQVYDEGKQRPS